MRQIKNKYRKDLKYGRMSATDIQNAEEEEEDQASQGLVVENEVKSPLKVVGQKRSVGGQPKVSTYANQLDTKTIKQPEITQFEHVPRKYTKRDPEQQVSKPDFGERSPNDYRASKDQQRKEFSGQKDVSSTVKKQFPISKRTIKQLSKEESKAQDLNLDQASKPRYYVEFNIKQQRNFERCIIDKQILMTPNRVITWSDIRIKDMRKFVYYQVLDHFSQLHPNNIELAYRVKIEDSKNPGQFERKYIALSGCGNMTIHDMIEKEYWQRAKCDLDFKERHKIPIGVPKKNETLYVRFIQC